MHHKLIVLILLITGSLCAHAQKDVLPSQWRDSNIVINGNPNDWDQPLSYYDSKAKIQYKVLNDASNLYIILKTMDPSAQAKIMRCGMEIWIDTSGRKKETTIIKFPLATNTKLQWETNPAEPEQQMLERPDMKTLRAEYPVADKRMKLVGFKKIPAAVIPADGKYGIEVAIDWDRDDVLTYELKIPFKSFYKETITAAEASKPITIGVQVNGFDVSPPVSTTSTTDPSMSNSGLRNQGYSNQQQQNLAAPIMHISDMSIGLSVQMRMKLAVR